MTSFDEQSEFPDQPIPLISFPKDENHLEVNEKAIHLLKQIQGKICVIAVAGLYRTGKSSMLNWLLGKQKGFQVGPTVERCTKGIWLWGHPQKHQTESGEDCWVVFLDTEGLGGLEATQQYDVRIFSLATLLCSTLIYNSQGSIDEKAIQGLSFIANLSKYIQVNSKSDEESTLFSQDLQEFFPSFLWIVRDFSLDLVDEDGDPITCDEYLQRSLAPQSGVSTSIREKNRVRKVLSGYFKDPSCFTIVRPLEDESKLQQIDNFPVSNLRPKFQEQLSQLKIKLFGSLKPKTINSKALSGSMFVAMLQEYVQAINSGGIPTITSAWDGVSLTESRNAMKESQDLFKKCLENEFQLPMNHEIMLIKVDELKSSCLEQFHKKAIDGYRQRFEDELKKMMDQEIQQLFQRNDTESKDLCERKFFELYAQIIQPKIVSREFSYPSIEEFSIDWTILKEKYMENTLGPSKMNVFYQMTESKCFEIMRFISSYQDQKYRNIIQDLEKELFQKKEEISLFSGKEIIFEKELETVQNKVAELTGECCRLEVINVSQKDRIDILSQEILSYQNDSNTIKTQLNHLDEILSQEKKNSLEKQIAMDKMQQENEKLFQLKDQREMEIRMLTEKYDSLRKDNNHCHCTIS